MMVSATVPKRNIGDNVIYKNNGVCCICDIKEMSFTGTDKKLYYVLSPVYSQGSHTYVPVDLPNIGECMHDLISRDDALSAIKDAEGIQLEWISDIKARAEYFSGILSQFDRAKTLAVIKRLSGHKRECEERRKKMYASDLKVLTSAEKMIRDEFAFIFGIKREEVFDYICSVISE